MVSNQTYLIWQKKLADNKGFRRFWVFWGVYSLLLVYAAGAYLLIVGEYRELFLALAAFVLARLVISPLIFLFYKKQRPYQKLKFTPPVCTWLFSHVTAKLNAFPSDHAASFASISAVIWLFSPILGAALLGAMILNGTARVILGYHHPEDILAGWLVGLLSGLIVVYWLAPLLFTR